MDERLHISLWMLGGGGFGGILGAVFGALAAAFYERNGGVAGTRLARNMVENFLQAGDRQPSPTFHAALIGAADGFFFVGGLGLIAGAFLGKSGRMADDLLLPIVVGSLFLVGGAILFGSLAYALRYHAAEILYTFAGSCVAFFSIEKMMGDGVYGSAGIVPGMIIGLLVCRAVRAYSPNFQPPRVEKTAPQPHSDAKSDITSLSPRSSNDHFYRKLDSFEEH